MSTDSSKAPFDFTGLKTLIIAGVIALLLSMLTLYLSRFFFGSKDTVSLVMFSCLMLVSRLFGIFAFVVGVVSIFRGYWTLAVALIVASLALPICAFHFFNIF